MCYNCSESQTHRTWVPEICLQNHIRWENKHVSNIVQREYVLSSILSNFQILSKQLQERNVWITAHSCLGLGLGLVNTKVSWISSMSGFRGQKKTFFLKWALKKIKLFKIHPLRVYCIVLTEESHCFKCIHAGWFVLPFLLVLA